MMNTIKKIFFRLIPLYIAFPVVADTLVVEGDLDIQGTLKVGDYVTELGADASAGAIRFSDNGSGTNDLLGYVDGTWKSLTAAGGSDRTAELVYRDDRYHEIFQEEKTQFPLHAIFNHEPKKRQTGETKAVFGITFT